MIHTVAVHNSYHAGQVSFVRQLTGKRPPPSGGVTWQEDTRMTSTPLQTLDAYVRAFETQRAEAVVPFYELPCTFIRPDGTWMVQDEATALALVNHLIDHARSQGYHRSEISQAVTRPLAAGLAELAGVFIRYDAAGGEIARFGFTYIVRGGPEGWRIVVAAAHDPVAAR